MQDCKGSLYFMTHAQPLNENHMTMPGKPQATLKTRQQWREDSRHGLISMPRMMGRRFTPSFVVYATLASIALLCAINSMLPPGW